MAYFDAAITRLEAQFLNVPTKPGVHSASPLAVRVAKQQQDAADAAPEPIAGATVPPEFVKSLGIRIVQPAAGSSIVERTNVVIKAERPVPTEFTLRVLRGYPRGGFVPDADLTPNGNGTEWHAYDFQIGGSSGQERQIEAWLVGDNGALLLRTWADAAAVHERTAKALISAFPGAGIGRVPAHGVSPQPGES